MQLKVILITLAEVTFIQLMTNYSREIIDSIFLVMVISLQLYSTVNQIFRNKISPLN